MKPIIRVEGLSKQYRIGAKQASYSTFRDSLTNAVAAPFRYIRNSRNSKPETRNSETIWALKDVSFEVQPGEVVGIIGRNGAGKSTLLKIASRITEPTKGRVDLFGRVGSLLEVGTGFHPELTGRENIYLNGAILGMKRAEIERKFDEIVAFAEISKFIDTPVKRYSSGMYMRLAFSIAAHLEPEVLIIDEVLAVGDAEFQKKCLGKMNEVAGGGRTVLFVSHQMGTVAQLCEQVIWLSEGQVVENGPSAQIVGSYIARSEQGGLGDRIFERKARTDMEAQILRLYTTNESGEMIVSFSHEDKIILNIEFAVRKSLPDLKLAVAVLDKLKRRVFTSQVNCLGLDGIKQIVKEGRTIAARVEIPAQTLTPGNYSFHASLHIPMVQLFERFEDIVPFVITDGGSEFAIYEGLDYGVVFVNCKWVLGIRD